MNRILVVTGDTEVRDSVVAALPQDEFELISVERREQNLRVVFQQDPHLILLDVRHPNGEGFLFLDQCISDPKSIEVPVIILGNFENPEEWVRGLDQGACAHLSLPFEPVELRAMAGVWLRVKDRLDRLKDEALIDELTEIFNRRYMESQLTAMLGEARRYHHPFSFLILDIDRFKRLNDSLGHPFGDLVLRETAALMRDLMRKEDVLARYGGEEFAILLPHTDRAGAVVLGERIRNAVAEKLFVEGEKQRKITMSLGCATYPLDEVETVEELVGGADKRLYQAKEGGRNQLVYE